MTTLVGQIVKRSGKTYQVVTEPAWSEARQDFMVGLSREWDFVLGKLTELEAASGHDKALFTAMY